jgi:hypothetical protein
MNRQDLIESFNHATTLDKVCFLLEFCSRLTLIGRGSYDKNAVSKSDQLVRVNEYQHRLIDIIRHIARESSLFSSEDVIERVWLGFPIRKWKNRLLNT